MTKKDFYTKSVYNCPECFDYKIRPLECDHSFIYVMFKINKEQMQLRKYCTICHFRDPQIFPHSSITEKAIVREESSYKEFIDKIRDSEYDDFDKHMLHLRNSQNKIFYGKYTQYIESEEWKGKRLVILDRDEWICQICKEKATDVHHLTYAHFMNEYNFELVSLCKKCHVEEYHSIKAKKTELSVNIPPIKENKEEQK